jgi:dolichyl-phosphate beta-glucosyltransferase
MPQDSFASGPRDTGEQERVDGDGCDLSLIVPIYNESARLSETLSEIADFLAQQPGSSELVLVDDGSSDGTADLLRELAPALGPVTTVVRYETNRGKGHALKVGFSVARGARILFTDADLSTPISEGHRLLAALDDAEIAVGSRKMTGSEITLRQPGLREWLGRGFTLLVRTLMADVSDATCGFKAFRGDVGRELFSRSRIDRWSFDAEILYLARRAGYRIKELPVVWRHDERSKVDLRRDVISSFVGLVRILATGLSGSYDEQRAIDVELEVWTFPASERAGETSPA